MSLNNLRKFSASFLNISKGTSILGGTYIITRRVDEYLQPETNETFVSTKQSLTLSKPPSVKEGGSWWW